MEIRMKNPIQHAGIAVGTAVLVVLAGWVAYAQASPQLVTQSVNEQVQANKAASASQSRINALDDETQSMLGEYRATVRETESLRRYNEQLEQQIKSQEEEVVSIQHQIEEIEHTNREIYPLMQRM